MSAVMNGNLITELVSEVIPDDSVLVERIDRLLRKTYRPAVEGVHLTSGNRPWERRAEEFLVKWAEGALTRIWQSFEDPKKLTGGMALEIFERLAASSTIMKVALGDRSVEDLGRQPPSDALEAVVRQIFAATFPKARWTHNAHDNDYMARGHGDVNSDSSSNCSPSTRQRNGTKQRRSRSRTHRRCAKEGSKGTAGFTSNFFLRDGGKEGFAEEEMERDVPDADDEYEFYEDNGRFV